MIDTIPHLPCADIFKAAARQFRADVLRGFGAPKKELPCKYFYDEVGSALFEQITELEEYYPTRTELGIMERHCRGDGRPAGATLPSHRVWQRQQPQDPAPPRPVARPGRLRAHRRLGRAPAPLGPGAGRGIPGPRGAAAVRRLHAAAGPARLPEGCRPTGGLLPRLDARQLHPGGGARLAATDGRVCVVAAAGFCSASICGRTRA